MKIVNYFMPTRQGILMGVAVGTATKNLTVGIILILIFSLVANMQLRKQ
jgi:hypothetical protein